MRRFTVPSLLLLLLTSVGARAGDFSGFYAGINVGYAAGQDRDRTVAAPVPGGPAAFGHGRAGDALPPSAAGAAAAMKSAGRTGTRPPEAR